MPTDSVLLVVNCQPPASYRNRRLLASLYGDRFPHVLFSVGEDCPDEPGLACLATPRPLLPIDNLCACCDPASDPHPSGRHATHPRVVNIASYAVSRGFSVVLFVEDDCLLSPRLDPSSLLSRLAGLDALIPYLGFCDRESASWVWTRHPSGYPAYDASCRSLDRPRLLRNWSSYSGQVAPPIAYTPLFGGFVDVLAFRVDVLLRMVPDLLALLHVWHEAAIPSAMLHQTSRIGRFDGLALWGDDRLRPAEELFTSLSGRDYVHPIKLSAIDPGAAASAYRRSAAP